MASIEELKRTINCHDLAEKLGLQRPQGKGNYKSPHHDDKNPSLSISKDGKHWQDYSQGDADDARGSCIDLYMYVTGCSEFTQACNELRKMYGFDSPQSPVTPREKSKEEWIAEKCLQNPERAIQYLVEERKIPRETVDAAIAAKSIGFNDWTNPKSSPGQQDYGGDAVSFIVRTLNPGRVVAVDNRYIDKELNGGLKTRTQGEKLGCPWYMDMQRLRRAEKIYVVESSINALSVEACGMPYTSAIAIRMAQAMDMIDWRFFKGKQIYICFDNDEANDKGRSPGREAAYKLYDILIAHNISAMLVDQGEWEHNDINDILQATDTHELKMHLQKIEPWAFQGLPGDLDLLKGKAKVFLPGHDFAQYWKFRVKRDFMTAVSKVDEDDDTGAKQLSYTDVAGFRLASISRVKIAGSASVLSGQPDLMPKVLFSVSVQTPRHKAELQRRVFEDEQLHNVDQWNKFGPVYNKKLFSRLVNIMERGCDLGSREAINFVGLGWLNGKLTVNEGKDSYFTDPDQQCPYSSLSFPTAPRFQAKNVIDAYAATYTDGAALIPLVWALGAHLKAFVGYWPHCIMQAKKGAGKSTLCKRLETTMGITIMGAESMKTSFRILTSVSHTSHPVGWEEISTNDQRQIDDAVSALQQCYQYTSTKRGSKMMEFMMCAPVLLAGEDVPVNSLLGKVVRTNLTNKKGVMLPADLSCFPVLEWLNFLSELKKDRVLSMHEKCLKRMLERSSAKADDSGAQRMTGNYAAVLTAWWLLCEFADINPDAHGFYDHLVKEMNQHIISTTAAREPWVWIMEIILSEIDAGRYRHHYAWGESFNGTTNENALFIRATDMINHLRTNTHLRDMWNGITIKSSSVLKEQMMDSGVVINENCEKTINKSRVGRMMALNIEKLMEFGLNPSPSESDAPAEPSQGGFSL